MATTILQEFEGNPTIDAEKVETIKEWYKQLQGDCDKASDALDGEYYQGGVDMAVSILALLYGYERIEGTDDFKKKDV